ncbi:AAA domain-containing protein [Kineococcus xinjiangensis]|uniref:AAA domain-containing protein n=1 Tax=Kineococcus xinjiangensis TaxID=512762 RepID=A0A2S6IV16_9ACTN|nr:AAA family ATPase [Kineococcus xinjiangensis]PPK98029.1 AAA domain-containing protein [Kineococcus xinjiangensis]
MNNGLEHPAGQLSRGQHDRQQAEPDGPRLRPVRDGEPAPAWTPRLWDADALMATEFPEPKWAVPGVLCEGVSLLVGAPKVGKSWLSLGLGLDVARGGAAFGRIGVQPGPVLYLALEDTPRRLQSRMGKLLNGVSAPGGLQIATDWPPLPAGGDAAIAAWLRAHPDARMVVLDVFAKMRGPSPQGMSAYDADYAAVGRAKRVADHFGIAVVLVHHVRKAGSEDFLQEVSGTNGIAGAADATLVLKRARGQHDGVLHVTGRDVEESEHALAFDPATGHWRMLDRPADEHALGDTRAAILRHLRTTGAAKPAAIATALDVSRDNAKRTCARMAEDGQLAVDHTGTYSAPGDWHQSTVPAVPLVPAVPEQENR